MGQVLVMGIDKGLSEEIRFLTQSELALRFRVSPSTIKNWRDEGRLEYFRVDGSSRVLYPKEAVEEFERRHRHTRPPKSEPRKRAEVEKG
jgi:excisionase family DNA binding protein